MTVIQKLGLGTVQWGMHYGINNQDGITTSEMVSEILNTARGHGIEVIDTANLYGKSEEVLGKNSLKEFKVVTKTPIFSGDRIENAEIDQMMRMFTRSQNMLGVKSVYGLLIHHVNNLLLPGGEKLVSAMIKLREDGVVRKIGVSVYDSRQVDAVLQIFNPDLVQLPLNVFDQRLLKSGHLKLLKDQGIEIHVRSVFLQGLLLMQKMDTPKYFDPIQGLLTRWHESAQEQGFTTHQAAIAFVKNIPFVDVVLVGLTNLTQLYQCIDSFSVNKNFDASDLVCDIPNFINPSLWRVE